MNLLESREFWYQFYLAIDGKIYWPFSWIDDDILFAYECILNQKYIEICKNMFVKKEGLKSREFNKLCTSDKQMIMKCAVGQSGTHCCSRFIARSNKKLYEKVDTFPDF